MCDYCSIGTEYLIYAGKRDNGLMTCGNHLILAVKALGELSGKEIIIERVNT